MALNLNASWRFEIPAARRHDPLDRDHVRLVPALDGGNVGLAGAADLRRALADSDLAAARLDVVAAAPRPPAGDRRGRSVLLCASPSITPFAVIAPAYALPAPAAIRHRQAIFSAPNDRRARPARRARSLRRPSSPTSTCRSKPTGRSKRRCSSNWSLFVHLITPDGVIVGQRDVYPGGGKLATSDLAAGYSWQNPLAIYVPPAAYAPETLTIEVGWYDLATGERLTLPDGAETFTHRHGRSRAARQRSRRAESAQHQFRPSDRTGRLRHERLSRRKRAKVARSDALLARASADDAGLHRLRPRPRPADDHHLRRIGCHAGRIAHFGVESRARSSRTRIR